MINGVEESTNSTNSVSYSFSNNNSSNSDSSNISSNNGSSVALITHVMYIKDIEKYTKLHICPKCGYIPPATNNGSYHRDRFEDHINNCDGKFKRSLCLNEQSVPFIPHI
jgi:hypothetical protein